ncbi:hypothetical protein CEXT_730221 [Caerostris extrusa]|uniref:Uncharacterized protein n=1 Tax=Caerostris extrusa TaxID=172846 RepID=A0AAV4NMD6_CAEEX|nr:hypothetical protein CEXT_730221 [Caerostris extrusa]
MAPNEKPGPPNEFVSTPVVEKIFVYVLQVYQRLWILGLVRNHPVCGQQGDYVPHFWVRFSIPFYRIRLLIPGAILGCHCTTRWCDVIVLLYFKNVERNRSPF